MQGHLEISGRAAFVYGDIRDGIFRVGDVVPSPDPSDSWTIRDVEFMDKRSERKYWIALAFEERPSLSEIEAAYPVGSIVESFAQSSLR